MPVHGVRSVLEWLAFPVATLVRAGQGVNARCDPLTPVRHQLVVDMRCEWDMRRLGHMPLKTELFAVTEMLRKFKE